jgi:hypothetical protein
MVCMCVNYNAYFSNCVLCLSLGTCVIRCVKGVVIGSHTRPLVTLLTVSNHTITSEEHRAVAEIRDYGTMTSYTMKRRPSHKIQANHSASKAVL